MEEKLGCGRVQKLCCVETRRCGLQALVCEWSLRCSRRPSCGGPVSSPHVRTLADSVARWHKVNSTALLCHIDQHQPAHIPPARSCYDSQGCSCRRCSRQIVLGERYSRPFRTANATDIHTRDTRSTPSVLPQTWSPATPFNLFQGWHAAPTYTCQAILLNITSPGASYSSL